MKNLLSTAAMAHAVLLLVSLQVTLASQLREENAQRRRQHHQQKQQNRRGLSMGWNRLTADGDNNDSRFGIQIDDATRLAPFQDAAVVEVVSAAAEESPQEDFAKKFLRAAKDGKKDKSDKKMVKSAKSIKKDKKSKKDTPNPVPTPTAKPSAAPTKTPTVPTSEPTTFQPTGSTTSTTSATDTGTTSVVDFAALEKNETSVVDSAALEKNGEMQEQQPEAKALGLIYQDLSGLGGD